MFPMILTLRCDFDSLFIILDGWMDWDAEEQWLPVVFHLLKAEEPN